MERISECFDSYKNELKEVDEWIDEQYDTYFASYFEIPHNLYDQMKTCAASDKDLEKVLFEMPLNIIQVSEQLSKLKTHQELIKFAVKEKEQDKSGEAKSVSGDKLLISAYGSIIDRVEREISYSRELIMSAKKIWDSRRSSETPVVLADKDHSGLKEYNFDGGQQYIK